MYIVTLDTDSPEYLEHHGVLGMHWGIRNAETQRKYDGGQDHSEARTDIANPTKGNRYQGEFKPQLSEKQTKMLKRAAAGVAIGAGLAAGVAVGAKSGVLKSVAKNGARKLADTAQLQARGKEFAQRVRTASSKTRSVQGRNELRRDAGLKAKQTSASIRRKAYGARAMLRTTDISGKIKQSTKQAKKRAWNSSVMAPVRRANAKFDYYTNNPEGKKKARNRTVLGATGAAFLSAPVIEGRSVDSRELRRKNGRHASTKWMRNKERLS